MKLAAFDIGGSAVKYGLWENQQLSQTGKFATPATFAEMQSEMKKITTLFGDNLQGVAISAPGAVNEKERRIDGISAVPYIHHRPIYDELTNFLQLPVTIENDANCAGICEVEIGAAKDAENVVFMVIGTGVGGAIFINRKIYKGSHLFGGEFGLMRNQNGRTLSLNGTVVKAAGYYSEKNGEEINGKELYRRFDAGEALAIEEVETMYQALTESLYDIQVSIDPEVIVLGGGISAREDIAEELATRLQKMLDEATVGSIMPTITTCKFHNDANLIGAALNFENVFQDKSQI
ncbi:putative NBD/HSP70 family sugar kinase [Enterococcus sp. PF1-24]|uniref:ROK family protein n=1 Tax=unclassified Enterococcus TaxID=2608891 RepID=UPI00247418EC|nr:MULTISPECIES: ROK family protein [unclassified Enterococcus]MDH6365181.1 putative NBD/HSP70 family sugar kinase [Enterococcus sp. PFB1-1]MDH6402235.1 putative NBD/HSP70 family sugar kinase [Enterococcus sp. PF1-24]